MDLLTILIALGAGVIVTWLFLRGETNRLRTGNEALQNGLRSEAERRSAAEEKNSRLPDLEKTVAAKEAIIGRLLEEHTELKTKVSELETRMAEERKRAEEKLEILEKAREQLKMEFQNIANRIFEDKSKQFTDQSKTSIDSLLGPVKEQLKEFRKKIEDVYDKESKDRVSLFHEINHLKELNQQISTDAVNLAKALKGQSKAQGAWGEMILERLLEESGLRKGHEYETQESFADQDGRQKRPDVIIRLPNSKDVIIDAKVSLTAYEKYSSAESEEERAQHLKLHITSVRSHLKLLSEKSYADLEGVRSLDFVLMFLPIEGAFMAALNADPGLFNEAFEKKIMIVCPSTLLATLRTINNIWRSEDQNRNALTIARQAGDLCDKFVLFVESLDDVGDKLGKAQVAYEKARAQLKTGRGNLISRTERLKKLGAKASKTLPGDLAAEALEEDNNVTLLERGGD